MTINEAKILESKLTHKAYNLYIWDVEGRDTIAGTEIRMLGELGYKLFSLTFKDEKIRILFEKKEAVA